MLTIEKLTSIESLLTLTQFMDKLKPKSVIALFNKVCSLQKELGSLRKNDGFNVLMDYIADNWSSGIFGPDGKIKDEDRVNLLFAMT